MKRAIAKVFLIIFGVVCLTENSTATIQDIIDISDLPQAAANAVAGDTILVSPGKLNEIVTITASGSEASPITIKSVHKHKAVLNGFAVKGNYITIDGFEITNNSPDAAGIDCGQAHMKTSVKGCRILNNYIHDIKTTGINGGTHALVKGNVIRNIGRGIFVNSHSLVENNEVDRLMPQEMIKNGKKRYKKSQYSFFCGDYITFRGNYYHGTDQKHLKTSMGSDFFVTWDAWIFGSSSNILIENNRCFDATHASESDGSTLKKSSHITFRNNLFVNTVYVGIYEKYWSNIVVEHNTFINCGAYPVWFQSKRETEGAIVRNNLISYWKHDQRTHGGPKGDAGIRNNLLPGDPSAAVLCENNMIWGTQNRQYGESDFTAEPMFVDPDNGDFRLKKGSPGIDAAKDIGIKTDLRGASRPQGSGPDVGAYEYCAEKDM